MKEYLSVSTNTQPSYSIDDTDHDGLYVFYPDDNNDNNDAYSDIDAPIVCPAWDDEDDNIIEDDKYTEALDLPEPLLFPNPSTIEADLQALIIGVLMAKIDYVEEGIDANEFDILLKEVTGRREGFPDNSIHLNFLGLFLNLTKEEAMKMEKDKANILQHSIFKSILSYSVVGGTFKLKLPDQLNGLYLVMQQSGFNKIRRREKAENVKIQKLLDPEVRRRCMISHNMLVELIVHAANKKAKREVRWAWIRDEYKEMLTVENQLYARYNKILNLEKIKREIGVDLNENSTRSLFGRGTISKALSEGIYQKLSWRNDEKWGIVLWLDGDYNDYQKFTYSREDFKMVHELIESRDIKNRIEDSRKKDSDWKKKIRDQEQEERRKTFKPIQFDSNNVFVPSIEEQHPKCDQTVSKPFFETIQNNRGPKIETVIIGNIFEKNDVKVKRETDKPFTFGNPNMTDDEELSAAEEEPVRRVACFTDDEEEVLPSREVEMKKANVNPRSSAKPVISPAPSIATFTSAIHADTANPTCNDWEEPTNSLLLTKFSENGRTAMASNQKHFKQGVRTLNKSINQPIPSSIKQPLQPAFAHQQTNSISSSKGNRSLFINAHFDSLNDINHEADNLNYDSEQLLEPTSLSHRALFINFLNIHVFTHRHIDGAPKRYWSKIRDSLARPLNRPEYLFGRNWISQIQTKLPRLQIIPVKDDYLFEYDDRIENNKSVTP